MSSERDLIVISQFWLKTLPITSREQLIQVISNRFGYEMTPTQSIGVKQLPNKHWCGEKILEPNKLLVCLITKISSKN